MSIARACKVEEVGPDLADIALSPSADAGLRNSAAAAAAALGAREVRARLRPLAFGEAGEDPDDELKGSGLKALWPDLVSASELFPLLTPPKQRGLSGTYTGFLYDHLIEKLAVADLPVALDWFSKQDHRQHLFGPMDRLMDRIVQFAWDNLEKAGVTSALATAIVSRVRLYDSILSGDEHREFASKIQQDQERRRMLLKAVLPQLSVNVVTALITLRAPIVASSDVEWLIERVLRGEAGESALVEARLVRLAFNAADAITSAKLWSACQTNEILNAECGGFFRAVSTRLRRGQYA